MHKDVLWNFSVFISGLWLVKHTSRFEKLAAGTLNHTTCWNSVMAIIQTVLEVQLRTEKLVARQQFSNAALVSE